LASAVPALESCSSVFTVLAASSSWRCRASFCLLRGRAGQRIGVQALQLAQAPVHLVN
jgi:hypothetical protein